MKKILQGAITTLVTTIFFTINYLTYAQANSSFDEVEIDQNQVVAIAMPLSDLQGYSAYKLMILEHGYNEKLCWSESKSESESYPVVVEPLLTDFNFYGICGRAIDSNGYSIRMDDNDLSLSHKLILQTVGGDIQLVGIYRSGDKILIGRTRGIANGIMKIFLEPGWQFTKRNYQKEVLGHLYFSYDSFAAKQAAVEQKIADIAAQISDILDIEYSADLPTKKSAKSE